MTLNKVFSCSIAALVLSSAFFSPIYAAQTPNFDTGTTLNHVPFSASATTDATNASNITSGILPDLRLSGVSSDAMTTSIVGGIARLHSDRAMDTPSIKEFGAICDGNSHPLSTIYSTLAAAQVFYPLATALTDELDSAAIQKGLALGIRLRVPASTCLSNEEATIGNNAYISGAGKGTTIIKATTAGKNIFRVLPFTQFGGISDMTLDRSVAAVAGASGIRSDHSTHGIIIHDVDSYHHWCGMSLSGTDAGLIGNVTMRSNGNHGICGENNNDQAWQWNFYGQNVSQQNGGDGYNFTVTPGSTAFQVTLDKMRNLTSFGNAGYGLALHGTSTTSVQNMLLTDPIMGEDGAGEIFLDTYGTHNKIDSGFFELSGSWPPPSGPVVIADQPCFNITAHNLDLQVTGTKFSSCGDASILSSAPNVQLVGVTSENPGRSLTAVNKSGFVLGGNNNVIVGGNSHSAAQFGVVINGSSSIIIGMDLTGNLVGPSFLEPDTMSIGNTPGTALNQIGQLSVNALTINGGSLNLASSVIISPAMPTACTSLASGTLFNSSGAVHVCP